MARALVLFGRPARHLGWRVVAGDVASARVEWEAAYRRLEEAAVDVSAEEALRPQVEAVTTELRRRVGGTFTLQELIEEYGRADTWAREALAELGTPDWPRTLALVEAASFHLYARGAVDYTP